MMKKIRLLALIISLAGAQISSGTEPDRPPSVTRTTPPAAPIALPVDSAKVRIAESSTSTTSDLLPDERRAEKMEQYAQWRAPTEDGMGRKTFEHLMRAIRVMGVDWDQAKVETIFWVLHSTLNELWDYEAKIAVVKQLDRRTREIEIPAFAEEAQAIGAKIHNELEKLIDLQTLWVFEDTVRDDLDILANGWGLLPQTITVGFDAAEQQFNLIHFRRTLTFISHGEKVKGTRRGQKKLKPDDLEHYERFRNLFPPVVTMDVE